MIENLAGLLSSIKKIGPVLLLAVSFATALMLFCPVHVADALGIGTFRATYRVWLGGTLIVAVSYLAAHLIWWLRGTWISRWNQQKINKSRQKQLHELTREEKAYLSRFITDGITSLTSYPGSGLAGGLVAKGIIFRSSSFGDIEYGFPYNIQPWARDYLQKHPELLETEDNGDKGAVPKGDH